MSVFRDQHRAPEVLNELRRRDWSWTKDLDEAIAVTVNEDGSARVHLSINLSNCEAVGWARLWGSFLSITLFLPLAESLQNAVDGAMISAPCTINNPRSAWTETQEAKWWKDALNPSDNFRRDVAALLGPSGSAVFMLLSTDKASMALRQLRNYGDTIVHTSVSADQDAKMLAFFNAELGGFES